MQLSLVVVVASMVLMFVAPAGSFIALAFLSTSCMTASWVLLSPLRRPAVAPLRITAGVASAFLLYGIFYLGNAGISVLHPLGIGAASESAIYSLIASPQNPLTKQIGILFLDSVGYEGYFRGTIQSRLQKKMGTKAILIVALADAAIHAVTLNPLWVATTFVADTVWGATYRMGGLHTSMASHFAWDLAVFIIAPIR